MLKKDMKAKIKELETANLTLKTVKGRLNAELEEVKKENNGLKSKVEILESAIESLRVIKDREIAQKDAFKEVINMIIKGGWE